MKNLIALIILFLSHISFAQTTSSDSSEIARKSAVEGINKVYDHPDQMPDFSKGLLVFRDEFQKAIVLSSVETNNDENVLKGMVSFIVEKDGSISNIAATGTNPTFNAAVKKAVGSIKENWNPAKHKGEIVRSRFVLPLTVYKNN